MLYPNNIKKDKNSFINYGNRGMTLESEISSTNEYYLLHDIAIVHKKPTPVAVVKQVNQKIVDALTYAMKHPDLETIKDGDRVLQEQRKNIKSV